MSSSSLPAIFPDVSITVTFDPNVAYIDANSSPIYPPPTITKCFGNSLSSLIDVLVYILLLSFIPGILGIID